MSDSDGATPAEPVPSAAQLAGLLADEDRRLVFAALVLGASGMEHVRNITGLDVRRAATAVGRLIDGGLVEQDDEGSVLLLEAAFSVAARAAARQPAVDEHAGQPPDRARVLRAYVKDGRLTSLPSSHTKRLAVFDAIVQDFEVSTHYSERQVNAILSRWLVDVGYLDRDHGAYWRCGGPVDA